MDFGTMKDKIVANEYKSVTEFKVNKFYFLKCSQNVCVLPYGWSHAHSHNEHCICTSSHLFITSSRCIVLFYVYKCVCAANVCLEPLVVRRGHVICNYSYMYPSLYFSLLLKEPDMLLLIPICVRVSTR